MRVWTCLDGNSHTAGACLMLRLLRFNQRAGITFSPPEVRVSQVAQAALNRQTRAACTLRQTRGGGAAPRANPVRVCTRRCPWAGSRPRWPAAWPANGQLSCFQVSLQLWGAPPAGPGACSGLPIKHAASEYLIGAYRPEPIRAKPGEPRPTTM